MESSTFLLRQIHSAFVDDTGRALSVAFTPTSKDQGRLSVYDGDQIAPREAYAHYTEQLGLQSFGTFAVNVAECDRSGVQARPDPLPGFQSHALVDFSGLSSRSQIKSAAKMLCHAANERGWLFRR